LYLKKVKINFKIKSKARKMNEDFVKEPFEDLKLNKWLIDQLKLIGYKTPTPIQYSCVPKILDGEDVIGW
jgi:superfamily II DNA/RNA helicase